MIAESRGGIVDTLSNDALDRAIATIVGALRDGGTLYAAGNGGSDCHAAHLVGELIGSFERRDRRPLPAVHLTCGPHTSGIANDFGWHEIVARQAEALVTERDVLVCFTTSGRSKNVLRALAAVAGPRALGTPSMVAFTGPAGLGVVLPDRIVPVVEVRSEAVTTALIQEDHQRHVHTIARRVEEALCPR